MTASALSHPCQRARERYGAELTTSDLAAMCRMIRSGQAFIEQRRRDGTWRAVVLYEKRAYFVVYSAACNRILTFFPKGWGLKQRAPTKRDLHRVRRRTS